MQGNPKFVRLHVLYVQCCFGLPFEARTAEDLIISDIALCLQTTGCFWGNGGCALRSPHFFASVREDYLMDNIVDEVPADAYSCPIASGMVGFEAEAALLYVS